MPDMTVLELIDKLKEHRPSLKVAIAEPASGQPNGLVIFRHVDESDEDGFITLDYPTQED